MEDNKNNDLIKSVIAGGGAILGVLAFKKLSELATGKSSDRSKEKPKTPNKTVAPTIKHTKPVGATIKREPERKNSGSFRCTERPEKDGFYYLAATPENYYREVSFKCPKCGKKIKMRTGAGRYGYLGYFNCLCGKEMFAQISDANGDISIFGKDDMPSSLIDNAVHKPFYVISEVDKNRR